MNSNRNPSPEKIRAVIESWLGMRLDPAAAAWVRDRQRVIQLGDNTGLYLAFGLAPRKVGKAELGLTAEELAAADEVRPGWNPRGWSVDQVTRTLFLLSLPPLEPVPLTALLDQLFSAGEVGELVALYQSLPLLPHPTAHVLRAAEGVRTNIKAVFCAIAHQKTKNKAEKFISYAFHYASSKVRFYFFCKTYCFSNCTTIILIY